MTKGKTKGEGICNRTIFTGDNLPVLRGMNSGSVDLIYLDPPFNSNTKYSAPIGSKSAGAGFKDTWTLDDTDLAWHGEIAELHPALYAVIESAGLTCDKSTRKSTKSYLIMMGVRLLEMHRILKLTGALYLHCDYRMTGALRMALDAIFTTDGFGNEIIWQGAKGDTSAKNRRFIKSHDTIWCYRKSKKFVWNDTWQPYSEGGLAPYKYQDKKGQYQLGPVDNPGGGGYQYDLGRGEKIPKCGYRMPKETALKWLESGELVVREGKVPRRKIYPNPNGVRCIDVWTDIGSTRGNEYVGYPTQKPLKLLERIITASSNKDDMILDPFCGCATTCVAAENLGRQWIGIDLSKKAVELVNTRILDLYDRALLPFKIIQRKDIPKRIDAGTLPHYHTHKHTLYGEQEGKCAGCQHWFPFQNFTVDHKVPQSKGGTDHLENLQFLCNSCNSIKGDREQSYLLAKLKERDYFRKNN